MWKYLRKIGQWGNLTEEPPLTESTRDIRALLGRSLFIRHLDAGSCNACELEIQALHNPFYNLEAQGVRFVASPRHADLLLVTGPVSRAMIEPLRRTYQAMPTPKMVLAMGDCPRDGGVFAKTYACEAGIGDLIPVDAYLPGCPPDPERLLAAILTLLEERWLPRGNSTPGSHKAAD